MVPIYFNACFNMLDYKNQIITNCSFNFDILEITKTVHYKTQTQNEKMNLIM